MILSERAFDNPFDSKTITPLRLYRFGKDVGERLATETVEPFVSLHTALLPMLTDLGQEIGEIDISTLSERGATQNADAFIANMAKTVQAAQLGIEYAFGGKNTVGYKAFFPNGLKEYTRAAKGNMEILTNRLSELAVTYATKLDPAVAGQFAEFKSGWKAVEAAQTVSHKDSDDNRSDRSKARNGVEIALLRILYRVGAEYAGNSAAALRFFDFSLLKAARHTSLDQAEKKG